MPLILAAHLRHALAALSLLALIHAPAHAADAPTPHQLIARLGVEIRQAQEQPQAGRTPQDVEQKAADQIAARVRASEADPALTEPDKKGRTPLMQAASDSYPRVVKALLASAAVRQAINTPDAAGETAWMKANFAPSLTLVACQPGALTLDRMPLLPPYVQRMLPLMKDDAAEVLSIVRMLEAAGATPTPQAATQAWLKRCPNATTELREALAKGPLLPTLINHSVARLVAFNQALQQGSDKLADAPPKGMQFISGISESEWAEMNDKRNPDRSKVSCPVIAKPAMPAITWAGSMKFKVVMAIRAGVVETADFEVTPEKPDRREFDKRVVSKSMFEGPVAARFRHELLLALAGYQCEGDTVFTQEFSFSMQ